MTRLEQVIQRASALPLETQDEMADQWLQDIENELGWRRILPQPQDTLSELARDALRQSAQGQTLSQGFDETRAHP